MTTSEATFLYQLPRGAHFTIVSGVNVPPDAPQVDTVKVYRLGNIDGMYSYCFDSEGEIVHIFSGSEVRQV